LGATQFCSPREYRPIWNEHRCKFLCGPLGWFVLDGWMNWEVELEPPALDKMVLESSHIQCAEASLGWLGTVGVIRFPLNLRLAQHR